MDRMLSKVPSDRLELLTASGFTWHALLAVWFHRDRRKLISYDAVVKRDGAWLRQWIAEEALQRGRFSIWFEQPPEPEVLDAILLELGW